MTDGRSVRLGDLVEIRHGWPFKSECFSTDRRGLPIVDASESLWSKLHENQAESERLRSLRDTLLPKLLSGELRVRNAERLIEART